MMINFYQAWKEDKESAPRTKKTKAGTECRICGKHVGGLKRHVEDVHGRGMWSRYLAAEERERQLVKQRFLELL
jgi:hypothetical protein